MLALAGIVIVFLAVLGGYLLERGNPYLLLQPAEFLIIVGAAAGVTLIANPPRVIRKMAQGAAGVLFGPGLRRCCCAICSCFTRSSVMDSVPARWASKPMWKIHPRAASFHDIPSPARYGRA